MSVVFNKNAFVSPTATSIGLAQMFTVTAGGTNPAYLVLTVLDRNEYTVGASRATGNLSGNGRVLQLGNLGGDGRGAGIVFAYQSTTGRYYSNTYGFLDELVFNSSASANDVTNLSLFGTSSLSLATANAANAYSMTQVDASGYLGSATVVTQPKFSGIVPAQATPNSIAAAASGFVGQAWNMDGCWVLASTIAAEAGASLPVQSTEIGLPGQANGEWFVAFNGPAGQSGNWQALVKQGEMIVIGTPGSGGHITTCVSGSGATAMLVDNATFMSNGKVQNAANDGSAGDIIIAAPHAASQEWAGVAAASVVIYELDTPNVACVVTSDSLAFLASQSLSSLFVATDPANKAITQYQVYDTATTDALLVDGVVNSDHSAASALTVVSLSSVYLRAGSTATTDTVAVRAFNGAYWGDWQSLAVAITPTAPRSPVVVSQTPAQTWIGGKAISLALPTATFSDPQGQTLSYSAKLSNGQALPSWLVFNPATDTFSGAAPTTAQTLNITVTATDTSRMSVSETFSATVLGAPTLTVQTPAQSWVQGKSVSLALPMNTFVDPQGQGLTYTASLSSGQPLPSWLSFNAKTETFSGVAPTTAQNLIVRVTATDSSGLSASENFNAAIVPMALPKPGITVTTPTAAQTWIDGQSAALVLPPNTFTDALGLKMTFAAYQVSGPSQTSWLRFNAATDYLYGVVPTTASGTIGIAIIASDAQNMTATDLFTITFAPAPAHKPGAVTVGSLGVDQLAPQGMALATFGQHG